MATAPAANTSATGGGRYFFRGKPSPQIVARTLGGPETVSEFARAAEDTNSQTVVALISGRSLGLEQQIEHPSDRLPQVFDACGVEHEQSHRRED